MLRSYIIIAWRNIMRSKVYSLINVAGLSLGVACCLLLALYIQDEMSYDKHHRHLEDVYRITTHFGSDFGAAFGRADLSSTSPPIGVVMPTEIPEIEAAARMLIPPSVRENLITYKDNIFYEKDGFLADSTLFDVLTYEFLEGNPEKALVDANSVVITDRLSKKLFDNDAALNKIITIDQGGAVANYKVTGVVKDNAKTFIHTNFIISMTSQGGMADYLRSSEVAGEWGGQNFVPAFVRLSSGHNKEEVVRKMNQVLQKYGADDLKALGMSKTLGLELVKDVYLRSDIGQSPRIIYLYVIASIAAFILLIACINFMNLSTARATKRAGEIGIRKVLGAFRSSLISQILGEAMMIVVFSILLSVILVQLALPLFNQLTGKTISFGTENIGYFIVALSAIALITGLVAGSYPAFYLSSFEPAQVLKGKFNMSKASGWLRRGLVVFQFMIAITLVCGLIVISRQLNFMQEKNLGFDARAKIVLPLRTASARSSYEALRNELQKTGNVAAVSGARFMPGTRIFNDMMFYADGGSMDNAILNFRNTVDHGYLELLDIKLIAGRSFTDNREMDGNNKVILNRTSVEKFGLEPEAIIGKHLYFDWQGKKHDFEVIGVMEDYHQTSLKEEIKPTMFQMTKDVKEYEYLIVSLNAGDFKAAVSTIEDTWKKQVSDTPFEYSFLDQDIQKQYDEDRKMSGIITSFTFIAMLISCLGLYGLSTYMAERRFKEIGVRKVMGASVRQIVGLMSKEFVKLVLAALIISVPLAWYAMDQWLQGFAYRIPIDALIFVYAGGAALIIALLTVSFESIKAASSDPVKALRNE
jgi:putative ABC transport system permease protein